MGSAIGKVINEMKSARKANERAESSRRLEQQKKQIRNNKSLYEDSTGSSDSELELKFMPSKPLDRDSWDTSGPNKSKNVTIVETEYGFKAVSVPSQVKRQLGAPPTAPPVFSPPVISPGVLDDNVLRID